MNSTVLYGLPHGTIGWFEVCDCGISRSYSLAFLRMSADDKNHEKVSSMQRAKMNEKYSRQTNLATT